MGEVIAVLSGKGGTGKTSLCAGIAAGLALAGCRVLCIDMDAGLRNLDIALGMQELPALSFEEAASAGGRSDLAAEHPLIPGLFLLTAPALLKTDGIAQPELDRLLRDARQRFDFCLLDAPAGIGEGFRLAASGANRSVLVAGADPASLRDAGQTADCMEHMGRTRVRLAVNRVNPRLFRHMKLTVDDIMDQVGLPLLGLVPEDPSVPMAAVRGRPLLFYTHRGAAAACRRIAGRLRGERIPLPRL